MILYISKEAGMKRFFVAMAVAVALMVAAGNGGFIDIGTAYAESGD